MQQTEPSANGKPKQLSWAETPLYLQLKKHLRSTDKHQRAKSNGSQIVWNMENKLTC